MATGTKQEITSDVSQQNDIIYVVLRDGQKLVFRREPHYYRHWFLWKLDAKDWNMPAGIKERVEAIRHKGTHVLPASWYTPYLDPNQGEFISPGEVLKVLLVPMGADNGKTDEVVELGVVVSVS